MSWSGPFLTPKKMEHWFILYILESFIRTMSMEWVKKETIIVQYLSVKNTAWIFFRNIIIVLNLWRRTVGDMDSSYYRNQNVLEYPDAFLRNVNFN